jgi:hypothetical protein
MATRYWVGGGSSTSWAATGNTNWAATSGGAGNASVPGSTDDVFFDASSGAGPAVLAANITIQSMDCTGFTGTLTHNSSVTLTIGGNTVVCKLAAGMTYSPQDSSVIAFTGVSGTATFTPAAQTVGGVTVNAVGGGCTLAGALTTRPASTVTLTAGTFDCGGFAISTGIFSGTGSTTRAITNPPPTITLANANGTILNFATTTSLTFTASATNVVVSGTSASSRTLNNGNLVWGQLTIPAATTGGAIILGQGGTWSQLNFTAPAIIFFNISTTTTITAAMTLTGTSSTINGFGSTTVGNAATVVFGSGSTATWTGVRDMTFSTNAFTATNSFDLGHNTNATITAPSSGGVVSVIGG